MLTLSDLEEKGSAVILLRKGKFPLLHSVDDEGGVVEKDVLPDSLHTVIGKALASAENMWKETDWLPNNCLRHASADGKQKVLIHVPAGLRNIRLFDQKIGRLPFPDLIFGFVLNGTSVYKKYVVAIKESFIRPDMTLYQYPYSHVHGDAQTCWNDVPEVKELWQLNGLPTIFFSCPDVGHLYYETITTLNMPYRQLLETMQAKGFFTKAILTTRNETLGDLWKRM